MNMALLHMTPWPREAGEDSEEEEKSWGSLGLGPTEVEVTEVGLADASLHSDLNIKYKITLKFTLQCRCLEHMQGRTRLF